MRAEKHPDLWAFLVHRPATRTNILCVKLAAGLFLYTLGAGLPLLGLLAFVLTPGRIISPFCLADDISAHCHFSARSHFTWPAC